MATKNSMLEHNKRMLNHLPPSVHESIFRIISRSPVPEDLSHAYDTLEILLYLCPKANLAMKIAAFGHDIERGLPSGVKAKRNCFFDYDTFKAAHGETGARVLKGILNRCAMPNNVVQEACRLVAMHEFGGDKYSDLLKDADSLSFFHNNLFYYKKREGEDEVKRRILWGLRRLSKRALEVLPNFCCDPDVMIFL